MQGNGDGIRAHPEATEDPAALGSLCSDPALLEPVDVLAAHDRLAQGVQRNLQPATTCLRPFVCCHRHPQPVALLRTPQTLPAPICALLPLGQPSSAARGRSPSTPGLQAGQKGRRTSRRGGRCAIRTGSARSGGEWVAAQAEGRAASRRAAGRRRARSGRPEMFRCPAYVSCVVSGSGGSRAGLHRSHARLPRNRLTCHVEDEWEGVRAGAVDEGKPARELIIRSVQTVAAACVAQRCDRPQGHDYSEATPEDPQSSPCSCWRR